MNTWKNDLEALKSDGWSYGYVQYVDLKSSKKYWLVDISRNGIRYSYSTHTIQEAVDTLYGWATTDAPGVVNSIQ